MTDLLTIPDVAKKLQVKERTVRSWIEKGTIGYIKLPQGIRFRPEWLENWIDKKTVKAKIK